MKAVYHRSNGVASGNQGSVRQFLDLNRSHLEHRFGPQGDNLVQVGFQGAPKLIAPDAQVAGKDSGNVGSGFAGQLGYFLR